MPNGDEQSQAAASAAMRDRAVSPKTIDQLTRWVDHALAEAIPRRAAARSDRTCRAARDHGAAECRVEGAAQGCVVAAMRRLALRIVSSFAFTLAWCAWWCHVRERRQLEGLIGPEAADAIGPVLLVHRARTALRSLFATR